MLSAVLLLIAAAGKHPYGFYVVLRLVITVGAVYWAWRVYKAGQRVWTWIFVAVALLLNPFLPIRMQRAQWQPIDLCLGIFLIGWSGYWLFRKRTGEFELKRPAEEKAKEIDRVFQVHSDPQRRRLHRIAGTAALLFIGGRFSTVVPSSESGLDRIVTSIITSGLAFGFFAWAAWLWSRSISKVLSKIGIESFAAQATVAGCLIVCAIHALNSFSLEAISSTPETQLRISVSGTSDASKRAVTNDLSGATGGCHPPVFSQQELSALEKQAASGDAAAQCGLGIIYAQGQGVPPDDMQAAFWYRKAAEQGDAKAQYLLGDLYIDGVGVPNDETQAVFWYRKGVEQNDAEAQDALGDMYDSGRGVSRDYAEAALWYRKAAEQDNADAQDSLGNLYYMGQGVPQDDAQAATWFRKAAWQGAAGSQYHLGGLYYWGRGVPQDYAEAYFWLDVADAGNLDALTAEWIAKYRDEAASHLTPADLFRAQERARKWFEAHQVKPQ
jgi:TPR repeat protein